MMDATTTKLEKYEKSSAKAATLAKRILRVATNLFDRLSKDDYSEGRFDAYEFDLMYELADMAHEARLFLAGFGITDSSPLCLEETWWSCVNCNSDSLILDTDCHWCGYPKSMAPPEDYIEEPLKEE
jgi:hypothetical protein